MHHRQRIFLRRCFGLRRIRFDEMPDHGGIELRPGAALDLRFADFTFPRARLAFANEGDAGAWHARIAGR